MKAKKIVVVALSLGLAISMVACNKKETTPANDNTNNTTKERTMDDSNVANNDYVQQYSRFYGDSIGNLSMYKMYETPEATTEYYKTNQYPGNQKYVEDLKAAYKDSRDKIQTFVNDLKNDAKVDDKKVSDMNQKLIKQGEKTISDIDAKLKQLDNLPQDAYNKSQDDFIKAVDEATKVKDNTTNDFNKLLNEMNRMLGIDPNSMNNSTNVDQNKK